MSLLFSLVQCWICKGIIMRDVLTKVYYDWCNNYLTIDKFAEHNGLTYDQALDLIDLARKVAQSDHPES